LKVGNKFSIKAFSLDLYDIININAEVVGKEMINYEGQQKEVYIVDYTMDIMGGIKTREWMTEDAEVYKMETASLGMTFVKVNRQEATGEVGQFDIVLRTNVQLRGEKPVPGIKHFKANVSLPEGDILKTFVNNDRQKVSVGKTKDKGVINITINDIDENIAISLPINDEKLSQYLKPSIYVQSDDPEIIDKAKEIVGTEKNSWIASMKICRWVYQNIKDKNYKVGFGTAKQTLKELQGDCSEHTVLFVGLTRALGIPSRIATGLVYHKDAFYYHFWPEVYIGRWVSMEPTLGQIQADASHIQFSSVQVETESNLELGEGVVRTLNRLTIERIE
ncbi:MAG: transglutaminase-like domain-containing protein, partial [Candidatus Poribacteria bacterium]